MDNNWEVVRKSSALNTEVTGEYLLLTKSLKSSWYAGGLYKGGTIILTLDLKASNTGLKNFSDTKNGSLWVVRQGPDLSFIPHSSSGWSLNQIPILCTHLHHKLSCEFPAQS